MAKTKAEYSCVECGWSTAKWVGRCGECQTWDSVQLTALGSGRGIGVVRSIKPAQIGENFEAKPITSISTDQVHSRPTGVGEFDRVLGGGIVPGAVVLLSGDPGVGKSTLLLEVAANSAKSGQKVLYVSGEESTGQIKLRASRK